MWVSILFIRATCPVNLVLLDLIFLPGAKPTEDQGPHIVEVSTLHSQTHTHSHTHTLGRTPPDEWSVRCRDLYLTTHNAHDWYPCHRGIRTRSPSKRTAADRRHRRHGYRVRPLIWLPYGYWTWAGRWPQNVPHYTLHDPSVLQLLPTIWGQISSSENFITISVGVHIHTDLLQRLAKLPFCIFFNFVSVDKKETKIFWTQHYKSSYTLHSTVKRNTQFYK